MSDGNWQDRHGDWMGKKVGLPAEPTSRERAKRFCDEHGILPHHADALELSYDAIAKSAKDGALEKAAVCVEMETVGGNKAPGSASRVLLAAAIRKLKEEA